MDGRGGLIPPHGGYRKLRSFQTAQLVYDGTVVFCGRFVDKRSRTHDQMVQAARSGVQNIAEGSMASATSKKTDLPDQPGQFPAGPAAPGAGADVPGRGRVHGAALPAAAGPPPSHVTRPC